MALQAGDASPTPAASAAAQPLQHNAAAPLLPLFEALAGATGARLQLAAGPSLRLGLSLHIHAPPQR
jgi:hypothetical protein